MRLKTGIWVAAYLRRCQIEGAAAMLRRRGAEEAGAIFDLDDPQIGIEMQLARQIVFDIGFGQRQIL